MANRLSSLTERQKHSDMTLLEIVVVIMVISVFPWSTTTQIRSNPFLIDQFKSSYLHSQFQAMAFKETISFDTQWGIDLRFNPNGNINRPHRIQLNDSELIIRLGTGRFHD